MSPTFGKSHPADGLVGVVLRVLALFGLALGLAGFAAAVARSEGISTRFSGYAAWLFFIPAISSAGCALVGLRASFWLVRALSVSERQFVAWQRNLLGELLFTGLGGFCVALGNVPGMASDLGPFGLIVAMIGLGFLAAPQAVLIDGERRRIVLSGVLYAQVVSFDGAVIAPLVVTTRGSNFHTWHLGLHRLAITPPLPQQEAHALAAYVASRTGVATLQGTPRSAPLAPVARGAPR